MSGNGLLAIPHQGAVKKAQTLPREQAMSEFDAILKMIDDGDEAAWDAYDRYYAKVRGPKLLQVPPQGGLLSPPTRK